MTAYHHKKNNDQSKEIGAVRKNANMQAEERKTLEEKQLHQTKYLLQQYRRVNYAVGVSEVEMNQRMEVEQGVVLSTLKVNAELAGIDLSNTKLERYAQSVIRSKNMIEIINRALKVVKGDPEHGELMYHILYLTYFTPIKPRTREVTLMELERLGYPMSLVTYHYYLNMAIQAIDKILWGYTARDCVEIVDQFVPDTPDTPA